MKGEALSYVQLKQAGAQLLPAFYLVHVPDWQHVPLLPLTV